jgi:1-acyl-sn-glycerol-3-phosphate acyltransferase
MFFLFTILYTYIYFVYSQIDKYVTNTWIYNSAPLKKEININRYYEYLFKLNKYLLNWSIETDKRININTNIHNKILVLCNHPKVLDGLFIYKYLMNLFPKHKIIFVVKKELCNIPLIGDIIKNNNLCLERNFHTDEIYIKNTLNKYITQYDKLIIVIFPEGTTYCKETIEKSNNWCKLNNLNNFKNVLSPRTSGIALINDIFKPDYIINNTIFYLDDINHNKNNYEISLLNFDIIHRCKIIQEHIPINFDFKNNLHYLWLKKDKLLTNEYNKLDKLYNLVTKYYNINSNLIIKSELNYQTVKLYILFLPLGLYCYGIIYSINVVLCFMTSYLFHKFNKYRYLDILISSILITLSFYHSTHKLSYLFLILSIICYFIGYLFNIYLQMYDISILFHNLLHIFGILHIIIEFIHLLI